MKDDFLARITISPNVCHGKPCIRGMRYPVEVLLEYMASGMTHSDILEEFSDLESNDLLACLQFAARISKVKSTSDIVQL